jgi:Zn finger protein HypA/HybF involved in hydrogenase expression
MTPFKPSPIPQRTAEKTCERCAEQYMAKVPTQKWCSKCAKEFGAERRREYCARFKRRHPGYFRSKSGEEE